MTKKKTNRQKRTLVGALCVAAVIMAGSTFAWFTSSDEVTNRLSASADYGVTIAEDFTPPTNWIPGQKVDKNVGVVNTGNVDAFVRMYMEGEMKILNQSSEAKAKWSDSGFQIDNKSIADDLNKASNFTNIKDTTDASLVALNLTKSYTDSDKVSYYFKMLDKTAVDNPLNSTITTNQSTNPAGLTSKYSEVQSIQAGGILAYAPDNAEYEYVLNQDTWLNVVTGDNNASTYVNVPKRTRVVVAQTAKKSTLSDDGKSIKTYAGTTGGVNTVYVAVQASAAAFKPVNVDTETFKPLTAGLYLFARNVDLTGASSSSAITSDYEFSGYYYSNFDTVYNATNNTFTHTEKNAVDNTSNNAITKGNFGEGTYYALRYELDDSNRSDYTVSSNSYTDTAPTGDGLTEEVTAKLDPASGELLLAQPTTNLALFTAEQKVVENSDLTWTYTKAKAATTDPAAAAAPAKLTATYNNGTANNTKDDIIIDVNLANIKGDSAIASTASGEFFQNTTAETWTKVGDSKFTFYYNNDVEEGDTTAKLIDSVTLSENVTEKAYMAFDFDLNVFMDSIQVSVDESGKELGTPINPKWDVAATSDETNTPNANKATAGNGTVAYTGDGNEITSITWTVATS